MCRQLASALHPGLHRLFYVPLSTGNVMDMYKAIAWQLGLPVERNRAAAYRAIHTEVSRLAVESRIHPVLVVDEAQHLRNDVLEDLRLLTNYEMDSQPRLCLLLVGLTELRRRLSMAVHESLAQRIVVRCHMGGLAREELPEYIAHRLRLADTTLPLFEPGALEALYQATHGQIAPDHGRTCAVRRRGRCSEALVRHRADDAAAAVRPGRGPAAGDLGPAAWEHAASLWAAGQALAGSTAPA